MSDLKEIKIFLASSIVEFDRERDELQTYITRLNKEYMPRGIYFDLEVCENVSNALAATRKQDEYNDIIRASRYVYLLVGERIGQYTEEEFDVALDQFRETGAPFIYTYFKRMPDGGTSQDQSVLAFMQRLGEGIGHYWSEYTDLDSIKLNIILELMRDPEVGGVVQFEDGQALLNGEAMVSLENVPIYSGNDNLQVTKDELAAIDEKRAELQQRIAEETAKGSFDAELMGEYAELCTRREELASQVHQMEMAMLDNLNAIASKSRSGDEIDPRERKAAELTSAGKYEEANVVLSSQDWVEEVDSINEVMEGLREKIRQYISGQRALIANLETMGITKDSVPVIADAYKKACCLAMKWLIELDIVSEYAQFLRRQRRFGEALEKVIWITDVGHITNVSAFTLARAYVVMSDLWLLKKQYAKAEEANNFAINLFEKNAEEGSNEELELGHAYVRQCETLYDAKRIVEAKEAAEKGLVILTRRERESLRNLGYAYNMLSLIERDQGRFDEAISLMRRAIEYRAKVAESGKEQHLRSLSISYGNISSQYRKMKKYDEAELFCRKCLEIRADLLKQNPVAHEAKYSLVLNNYANLLIDMGRYDEAEKYVDDAIAIRRRLAEDSPDVSLRGLAVPLHTKGWLIVAAKWEDRYQEARDCLEEAYGIRKKAYEESPQASALVFGQTCEVLARLCSELGEHESANGHFNEGVEAIKLRRQDNPHSCSVEYSQILCGYALFLHEQGDNERAEELIRESFEIRKKLFQEYPEIYKEEFEYTKSFLDDLAAG